MLSRPMLLFFLLSVGLSLIPQLSAPATEHRPIFRDVTVSKGETITLGAPLSNVVRSMLRPSGRDRYQLREGTFGGAQALAVQLTSNGLVQAIFFDYASGTDYAAKVATYRKLLGEPARQTGRGESAEQVTLWEDANTVFEIEQRQSTVRAAMYDRKLANR